MAMWLAVATSATITMNSFLLLTLISGSVIALTAGPLGAFVVWRRMAYFGDTLAHSALLGVAFGIVLNISPVIGIVLASSAIALLLWWMQKSTTLANDSLLGILSHSALALGLVCVGLFSNSRIDLYGYLFGDLLTVNMQDIAVVCAAASVILGLVCFFWRSLLMIAIDESLAKVEGLAVEKLRLMLMLLMALLIAIAMKAVGILLITALLIIPPAAARKLTSSPEAMAICAACIGVASVWLGLAASYFLDTAPGPSIVIASTIAFIITSASAAIKR